MHRQVRYIICENKEGYLLPIYLGVRLAWSIEKGLTYMAALYFEKNADKQPIIMNLDQNGSIIQSNRQADRYLTRSKNLHDIVDNSAKIVKDFDFIVKK